MSLKETRIDYNKESLGDQYKDDHPSDIFNNWLVQAKANVLVDYNAMSIATVSKKGFPSSRIVLLREFSNDGFVFYTNYNSDKGQEIANNNQVSLNFFWKELEKQVCIKGLAEKVEEKKSDDYFASRPRKSQIGAWASSQSSVIESRKYLLEREKEFEKKFEGMDVPRPEYWGGYIIKPSVYEFWQGRSGRLHDRLKFVLTSNGWKADRLSP